MTIADLLRAPRYVVDESGRTTDVLVDIRDWERLQAWIENVSDTRLAQLALDEIASAGDDAARADWVEWASVRDEWLAADDKGD